MIETALVGEATAGESAKLRKELEALINTWHTNTFDVARVLHKIRKNKLYYPDFETFSDYCRSLKLKLDVTEQTIKYWEHIIDVMEQVGLERNTYEPLGVSRLKEISSLDPNGTWTSPKTGDTYPLKDFIVDFVEKGDTIEYNDLKQQIKTLKGLVGDYEVINKTFGWPKAVWEETIQPTIELAKRHIGSIGRDEEGKGIDPSDSKALEIACIDFLNSPENHYE